MENMIFWSDMAIDNLENNRMESVASHKKLSFGVVESVVNLKNKALADRVGKPQGVYVTYDVRGAEDPRYAEHLSRVISSTLRRLIGGISTGGVVLAVGLGNGQVLSDSLGTAVMSKLRPTRQDYSQSRYNLCAHSLGVQGVTGIKSNEVLSALAHKLKPSAIIVVDSLATANADRLGTSFQISTAGIVPGGGIRSGAAPLNKETYGVPTLSIGVPLVLTMQGVVKGVLRSYGEVDEFKLQGLLSDKKLSHLIVAPKEVKAYLDNASDVISNAINLAYSF